MPSNPFSSRASLLWAVLALLPAAARADGNADSPPITPYRPSVSSPAQLPAPGQLEMELGGLRTRVDNSRRDSLPYLLKLAFSNEWGVLLGGEAHVSQHDASTSTSGFGDTTLVLKRAWVADDSHAGGIELSLKLPTANDTLGSGKADYGINFIESIDSGSLHTDVNFNVARLGAAEEGTSHTQLGASAAFSVPLNTQWSTMSELSGTHRGGTDTAAQLLGAFTYSPSKRLTFDFGVARGLRPTPHPTSYFAGVVFPITQLW